MSLSHFTVDGAENALRSLPCQNHNRSTSVTILNENGAPMNPLGILFSVVGLSLTLPFAYRCWFKPKGFMSFIKRRRKNIRSSDIYSWQEPWVRFLEKNPPLELALTRLVTLFAIFVWLGILFVSCNGPITVEW